VNIDPLEMIGVGYEYSKLRAFFVENKDKITNITTRVAESLIILTVKEGFYDAKKKLTRDEAVRNVVRAMRKKGDKLESPVSIDMRVVLCSLAQLLAGAYDTIKKFNGETWAKILINAAVLLANEFIIASSREYGRKGEDICIM